MESLWGSEFSLPNKKKESKKILDKQKTPKDVSVIKEKTIKSKTTSIQEKLKVINTEVLRILGTYKENTQIITSKEELVQYFDFVLANNIIAIDTETNNSLDPITCKLMGPCFYTPGLKNTYVPINHVDWQTGIRLESQLTEEDIAEQLRRINSVFIIMHNGKFDYQVLHCTCHVDVHCDWDTMIAAKILNENERAGLKEQYIEKIDPTIEKYSIDHLFHNIEYAFVSPEIFALYSATDPYMTFKLFEYQKKLFEQPENKKLYHLFKTIEMPVMKVLADMELNGMSVDQDYAKKLSIKYHKKLQLVDDKINVELQKLSSTISSWKLTEEANRKQITRNGLEGKSKAEQLTDPINLASPTQLAILFYDILKVPVVDKKAPRGTGEDILKTLSDKEHIVLCDYLLERRGLVKLIDTYIDNIPQLANRWPDGRVRTHFNQYGADTGRLSSSDPLNF